MTSLPSKLPPQYLNLKCQHCSGKGKIEAPPPTNTHSEAYASYMQGFRKAAKPCTKCQATGSRKQVNPAWLIAVREQRKVDRRDFAQRTGRTYSHIANVENGYAPCTPEILEHYLTLHQHNNI